MQKKFIHPGIGCSKETLAVLKDKVSKKKEPWYSYYTGLLKTQYSRLDYEMKAVEQITNNSHIDLFRRDAEAMWTHMIIYSVTGNSEYLKLPQKIISRYSESKNFFPAYFTDSHIKLGKYVYTMCSACDMAREIFGEDAVLKLAQASLRPIVEKSLHFNGYFMNQHTYSILGSLAYSILTDDFNLYKETVEWALVNKHAENQGRNGAMKAVIRETSHIIELVEMGRDMDHAEGNLNNLLMMTRTMLLQNTTVNDKGEISENGIEPIHFLNDRLLEGFEKYAMHNLGFPVKWVPAVAESVGTKVVYQQISPQGEGNFSLNGIAAAYFMYKSMGMTPKYVKMAYEVLSCRFKKDAESGYFIEALHNYTFDFFTCLTPEAEDEARCYDALKLKNITVGKYGENIILKGGDKICVFTSERNGFALRLKSDCVGKVMVETQTGSIEEYVINTHGKWRLFCFDIKVKNRMFISYEGDGSIELDSIAETHLPEFADDTKTYDTYIGRNIEIDASLKGDKEETVQFKAHTEGEHILYLTAQKGDIIRVKRVKVNVLKTLAEAKKKACEAYCEDLVYEFSSQRSLAEAKATDDLLLIRKTAEAARLLNPRLCDGSLDYSKICKTNYDEFLTSYIDDNPLIFGSVWNDGLEFIMDFGEGFKLKPERFYLQARGGFPTRVNNSAFYGSNDGESWTKITKNASITPDVQIFKAEDGQWRYIKIKRGEDNDVRVLDIGVLKIFGERIEAVNI